MNAKANKISGSKADSVSGYAPVDGLKMYYEIYGKGTPLVLIHGGGSTIQTTFGMVIHLFAAARKVIAVELQGHGHTTDRDLPESFEQDADDVAALLKYLKIEKADFFGFSNGGNTTIQVAIRHPGLVRKIVFGSTFYKREGFYPEFWESLRSATLDNMPLQLKEAYKKVAPDANQLSVMFTKDKTRMLEFTDWNDDEIRSITACALIINGDQDVIRPEHAAEMFRLLPNARLSIIPGPHGAYIGEVTTGMANSKLPLFTVSMIEEFLNAPEPEKN
jgi:pimeloyl-ACP methyl ester carboxylesterase